MVPGAETGAQGVAPEHGLILVREARGGVWHSQAPHPDWRPEADWELLEGLRPLLELPVELVLPTHGVPADRAALERSLS